MVGDERDRIFCRRARRCDVSPTSSGSQSSEAGREHAWTCWLMRWAVDIVVMGMGLEWRRLASV